VKDANAAETQADANAMILGGLGIGAPALLGLGAYKRWKAAKQDLGIQSEKRF
jgi:hypothetical protein